MNRLNLFQTPAHDCPYLDEKMAITQFIDPESKPNIETYTHLTTTGFRRSGEYIYRPSCPDCSACISVRIPVDDFVFKKSQRRILNRAINFEFTHLNAEDSDEHFGLYELYINTRHKGGDMHPATRALFQSFLLSSWANTQFLEIRDGSKLVACAVYDRLLDGISAVYCYFDPDYSHYSLGKLAILKQIQFAQTQQMSHLYLGYQINDCAKMNYKNKYRPIEEFSNDQWHRIG